MKMINDFLSRQWLRTQNLKLGKSFCILCTMFGFSSVGSAQHIDSKHFNATAVFRELDQASSASVTPIEPAWWDSHVTDSLRDTQPLTTDIHTLLYLALQHSNQIKIAKREPLIRETAIPETDSRFDWVKYLDAAWNDTSEPIGNNLTAGGTATQFDDQVLQATAGLRRLTRYGGILDISQRFGWQDNNSVFLVPNQQATSQFTVSYTHPLLRGRGLAYNNSLVLLAQLDADVAEQEFLATLQEELLEITRGYWALYLERAVLAHQLRLYLKTQEIYNTLEARQIVDTQRTQLVTAGSALENRRSDLIRARTAVTNAETRLRGLINAPELGNSDQAELVPAELPAMNYFDTNLRAEIQKALQNRPEIQAAIKQVKVGSEQLGIAQHELLPALNLVTETYLNGLRGDSDFSGSFGDQFSTGRPSYSLGIQYELPIGNRLAKARLCRRQHEVARLQDEYARAIQAVQTEVDIAVRELKTAYLEIPAKQRALQAAEAEANTIEQRWLRLIDGSGTSALNLESLLRAQERVTAAEREYVDSLLTYNLAMVSLKRSNGTLLQAEDVVVDKTIQGNCKAIDLTKGQPASNVSHESLPENLPENLPVVAPVIDNQSQTMPPAPAPVPPIIPGQLNYFSQ